MIQYFHADQMVSGMWNFKCILFFFYLSALQPQKTLLLLMRQALQNGPIKEKHPCTTDSISHMHYKFGL